MTMSSLHARRLIATGFLFAAVGMLACEGDPATSPDGVQIRAAKPPKDDGGDPTVISALPAAGEQGAVGLQIHVFGTGFEKGAKVAFHLDYAINPDPDPGMTVQSTKFVNDTELIATTDIALDAKASSRDISVSFRGRRGIGTETFDVKLTGKPVESLATFTLDIDLQDMDAPGLYDDGAPFENEPLDQALIVDCEGDEGPRTFVLVRPDDWEVVWERTGGTAADEIHCSGGDGFSRLDHKLGGLSYCADDGGCKIEQHGHDLNAGPNFGPDLNYYFRVKTGKGKGKFAQYNVVWTNATFQSFGGNESADPPIPPCSWLLVATEAEFWEQLSIKDDVVQVGVPDDMALKVLVQSQADDGC